MSISRKKLCLYSPVVRGDNTIRTTILKAASLGMGGVELMNFCDELRTPDMDAAKELGALAKSHGLAIPCFSVGADILSDPAGACENIKAYADICASLEIPLLHHTVALDFTAWDIDDDERARRFNFCTDYALELGEYARSIGVTTIIEDQGFVFNGVKNCDRLCKLSDEKIRIVADTGNIMFYDEKPADFIRAMGQRVVHAHLKDYRFTEPFDSKYCYRTRLSNYITDVNLGEGDADIDDALKAFADIGYNGYYSFEGTRSAHGFDLEKNIAYLEGERHV